MFPTLKGLLKRPNGQLTAASITKYFEHHNKQEASGFAKAFDDQCQLGRFNPALCHCPPKLESTARRVKTHERHEEETAHVLAHDQAKVEGKACCAKRREPLEREWAQRIECEWYKRERQSERIRTERTRIFGMEGSRRSDSTLPQRDMAPKSLSMNNNADSRRALLVTS